MTRILGIVGGTGPESTINYYRSIIGSWRRRNPDGSYPRLILNSVEAGRIFWLLGEREFAAVAENMAAAVGQLAAAGAGAAILASKATHLAFEAIEAASPIPLIHIVDAAREAAHERGHHRLGIFGTRFVMEASMYPERFAARGTKSTSASSSGARSSTRLATGSCRSPRGCASATESMA